MENLQLTMRQKQKEEAIKRMKKLKIMSSVINDFKKSDTVYYSENCGPFGGGILYWVSNQEDFVELIDDFEKKNNSLVYHAELSHLTFGDCLSLLYVSDNEEEWEFDNEDLDAGYAFVYVYNIDDEQNSQFGTIGIAPMNGGVVRTA